MNFFGWWQLPAFLAVTDAAHRNETHRKEQFPGGLMSNLKQLARNAVFGAKAREYMLRRGCNQRGDPLWQAHETAALKALYPDSKRLGALLPVRTTQAIRYKAWEMGLSRKRRPWTGAEVTRLRRLFPKASVELLLESFPARSKEAIYRMAHTRGMLRDIVLAPTGHIALDQIRARCAELKISLADLARDLDVQPFYFQRPARESARAVHAWSKAAKYLGGRLEVVWNDYPSPARTMRPVLDTSK